MGKSGAIRAACAAFALFVAGASFPANAQMISNSGVYASTLMELCATHKPRTLDPCGSYIFAVADTLELSDETCRATGGSGNLQVEAVVLKYLRDNPEQWHKPAVFLIRDALKRAFPCPRKKSVK